MKYSSKKNVRKDSLLIKKLKYFFQIGVIDISSFEFNIPISETMEGKNFIQTEIKTRTIHESIEYEDTQFLLPQKEM